MPIQRTTEQTIADAASGETTSRHPVLPPAAAALVRSALRAESGSCEARWPGWSRWLLRKIEHGEGYPLLTRYLSDRERRVICEALGAWMRSPRHPRGDRQAAAAVVLQFAEAADEDRALARGMLAEPSLRAAG